MTEQQERIVFFQKSLGISMRSFESSLGMSSGSIKAANSLSQKLISKLSEVYPNLNINWILTGEGKMITPETSINIDVSSQSHNNGGTYVNGADDAALAALQKENEMLKEHLKKVEEDKAFLQNMVDKLMNK